MRLGIIGAGRVGASFCLALKKETVGIFCSTIEHTREKAARLQVPAFTKAGDLAQACDVVLLSVRDDAIAPLAQQLAKALQHAKKKDITFLHCSGAMDLSSLQPLQALGFSVGSLHPLQSFAQPASTNLQGIYMAVDGDEKAKKIAGKLAHSLGSVPFFVPAEERMLYHAAACFCSNYVVTLVSLAQLLMSRWTATPAAAAKALWPLFQGTADNLQKSPEFRTALTGPIARGDLGTVRKHLDCLPQALIPLYCTLGKATAKLAQENGTITTQTHDDLTRILAMAEREFQNGKKSN